MRRLLTAIAFGSAVVVIPLSIATVVLAAFLAVDTWNGHGNPWTPFMVAIGPLVVVTPIVAVVTVLIGLPVHFAMRETRYATDLGYNLAGGAVGFALPALPFLLDGTYEGAWMPRSGSSPAPRRDISGGRHGHDGVPFVSGRRLRLERPARRRTRVPIVP